MLLGSETPRLATPELRPLTPATSLGFEAAEFAEGVLGLRLHPWQRWLLLHMLELAPGRAGLRFRTVVVLVGRQNGKTTLMLVLALWRMYVDRAPLVLGTAQNLDVSEEAWESAVALAESVPELAAELDTTIRVNGKKAMRLRSGERYKVAAASRRGGRGLSADLVMLDELREHQSWASWSAVSKTTMARPGSQILATSNAGDASSVVLRSLRDRALARLDDPGTTVGLFDWSAPDGCAMDDRDGWAAGNPSLGHPGGVTEDAIVSALDTDPEWVFRTEVLCQWQPDRAELVIPARLWDALADPGSQVLDPVAVGVHVSRDRSVASVAVCGAREDGVPHVELVANTGFVTGDGQDRDGIGWLREVLARLAPGAVDVVGDEWALAGVDLGDLEVTKATTTKVVAACGSFFDAVVAGQLRHLHQGPLSAALSVARRRDLQRGWVWDDADPAVGPLVAATLAHAAWMANAPAPDYDPLSSIY